MYKVGVEKGSVVWGANRRGPDGTEDSSRVSLSRHDKASFVEQEADRVDEHVNRKGLVAVHEVADEDEEEHEDIQMEW